jgi:PIN domain nuclease of toxin-antitoxin system
LRLLLDTHALIWWGHQDPRLGAAAMAAIAAEGSTVFVSAASAMEITTKHRIGKLPEAAVLAARFESEIEALGFHPLSVTLTHARFAGSLAIPHKDPFDRLLIAQAIVEDMLLVSNEAVFDGYGVNRLW